MPTARELLPFAGTFKKEMFFEPTRTSAAGYLAQLPCGRVGLIYKFVEHDLDRYRVCTTGPDTSLHRAWHRLRSDAYDLIVVGDPLAALACLLHLDQKYAQSKVHRDLRTPKYRQRVVKNKKRELARRRCRRRTHS